jgi:hypothetical protein
MIKGLSAASNRRAGRVPPKDHLTMQRMFQSYLRGLDYVVRPKGLGRYEVRTPQPKAVLVALTQGFAGVSTLAVGKARTVALSGSDVRVVAETRRTFDARGEQGWVGRPPRRGGNGFGGPMSEGFSGGSN